MKTETVETIEYLNLAGMANMFQVSQRTAARLVKEADFPPPIRIRGCVRWSRSEVLAYLRSRTETTAATS